MQNKHQWTHGHTFWLQNKASRANSEQESRLQHVGTCYQREPKFWHHCTVQCWNEKCLLPPLKWVLCIVGEVLSHAMTLTPLRRMCDLILSHHFWPQLSVSMQWGRIWEVWRRSFNQSGARTPVSNDSLVFWHSDGKIAWRCPHALLPNSPASILHPDLVHTNWKHALQPSWCIPDIYNLL